jgi:hypothetical protein
LAKPDCVCASGALCGEFDWRGTVRDEVALGAWRDGTERNASVDDLRCAGGELLGDSSVSLPLGGGRMGMAGRV